MTYQLFLDDLRDPPAGEWMVARSFQEAVDLVECLGFPALVSFDHDLGDFGQEVERTGYDFAKWLVEQDLDRGLIPSNFNFRVHSANPIGKRNIEAYLESYLNQR